MLTSLRGSFSLWWKAVEALFDGSSELFCCLWSIFHFIFGKKSLLQENVSFYFYFYSSFLPQIFMGEDARTPNKNWWGLILISRWKLELEFIARRGPKTQRGLGESPPENFWKLGAIWRILSSLQHWIATKIMTLFSFRLNFSARSKYGYDS